MFKSGGFLGGGLNTEKSIALFLKISLRDLSEHLNTKSTEVFSRRKKISLRTLREPFLTVKDTELGGKKLFNLI